MHGRAGMSWRGIAGLLWGLVLLTAAPRATSAQVISPEITVTLGARRNTTLSVTVLSGATQTMPSIVDNAINPFPAPVRLQTSWNVNPGLTGTVEVVAYFLDATTALDAGGGRRIAPARVEGRMATGLPVAFTPFTGLAIGGVGTAGATLRLVSERITGLNRAATRTDDLDLRLNLVGQPALPAGTYAGTLYIRAVTQ